MSDERAMTGEKMNPRVLVGKPGECIPVEGNPRRFSYDGTKPEDLGRVGVKFDEGKPMLSYIPYEALEGAARIFMHGAKKYSDHNWRMGMPWTRLWNAAQRHLWAWKEGQDIDPDSALPVLDHAICCLMMLRTHIARQYGTDDRFKEPNDERTDGRDPYRGY